MYQARGGFLEELTVSWDLDEEQGLPRCRRRIVSGSGNSTGAGSDVGTGLVCAGVGV